LCIAIEGLECAGELVKALTAHSEAMTALYRELHTHTGNGVDSESIYTPIFEKASNFSAWFKARKKVANSMKAASSKTA